MGSTSCSRPTCSTWRRTPRTASACGCRRQAERTPSPPATSGDRILGFTIVGPEAGEVMAAVQTAMLGGLPYTVFCDAILTHPTMAEGLNALFAAVPPAPS